MGGLLATLLPRAQIVPAVPIENLSNDPEVVRTAVPQPPAMGTCASPGNVTISAVLQIYAL